jgi:hypothetical protein
MSTNYQLEKDQERLSEFSADPEITSLEREISLMRLMIEQAARDGNNGQAMAAATTLARLVTVHESAMARKDQWVSKRVVVRLGEQVGEIIISAIRHLPDCEDIADSILSQIANVIAAGHNERDDIKLITGKRNP